MEKSELKKIPILDMNFSTYHHMNDNTPELTSQGTRITFLFRADETFFRLSEEYNSNIKVNVLDFVNAQRQLKAMMMSLKNMEAGR